MAIRSQPLAGGLAVACLLACASPPDEGQRSILEENLAQSLLILPLNVTAPMPDELEALSPLVWTELERYLRAHGKDLKTVNPADAQRLWLASIRRARGEEQAARPDFDDAARLLAIELARHADFDAIIVPSLFVRPAPILGRRAEWDGVERDVEFEVHGFEARSIVAGVPLEGTAPAASLHAVVLNAQGERLQEGRGGLELLVRVEVRTSDDGSARQPRFEFATRTDLFSSREHLREGIAEALKPFLPPLRMD